MSDKEIFTREETSNLIQQARKQGAVEVYNQIKKDFNMIGLQLYCDKKLKELSSETK